MLLQQCAVKSVALTAIETQCGFQPFFTYANENYTVGIGWMVHSSILCMFLEITFCQPQRKCIRMGA